MAVAVEQRESEGELFAMFCETTCIQSVDEWNGQPMALEPWQRELMDEAMLLDEEGRPFWRGVVVVLPRKNGKTHLLAAYALYRLMTMDGRPEILMAASSDKQAGRLFEAAAWFVRKSPELRNLFRIRDMAGEILNDETGGKILRMASDAKALHGYSPSLVICDELAQWSTPTLRKAWGALTTGGAARSAPQTFVISTAGAASERESGLLGEMMNKQLATGVVERPYAELAIARHEKSRRLMYAWEAQTEDKLDVAAVKRANPASWITAEYLAEQASSPEVSDADYWQLHANVWAAADDVWIPPSAWQACATTDRSEAEPGWWIESGSAVAFGADGSRVFDTTVVATAAERDGRRRGQPFGSIRNSTCPYSTGCASVTVTSRSVPEYSDSISFMIFIASMMQRICPLFTREPTVTYGLAPGSGEP